MKKIFLSAFLFMASTLCTHVYAQKGSGCSDDLIPKLGENKNWGYADLFGQWVIEPIYAKVSPFVESKAVVQKGNLSGVIDCEGNVILQCNYERLTNFRNGKVWAQQKGVWGLMGAKGQVFQVPQFNEINPIINSELSWVKKDNVWGLFNEEKNVFLCKPQYKMAQVMSINASLVQVEKTFGVINHVNCSYLLPLELTRVKKLAAHDIMFEQNGMWGVFNDLGKTIINPEFDTIVLKLDEILLVKKNNKFGLYGLQGKKLLAAEYDEIGEFSEGFFKIRQGNKYGYCSRLGKVYIKPIYIDAKPFNKKQAVVKTEKGYGIIDYTGKFLLKPEYADIQINDNFYAVKQAGKYSLFSNLLKKISEETFDSVYTTDSITAVRVKNNGKVKYYNVVGKIYLNGSSYDEASSYKYGFAFVYAGGKKGVIDKKGVSVIPVTYDGIEYDYFQNKLVFRTLLNGKEGVVETTGKVIIPNEYEKIIPALPNYLKVKKNGKYGILRTSGEVSVEAIYDQLSNKVDNPPLPEWPAVVSVKDKFGLISPKGEEVLPAKAKELKYVGGNLYAFKEGKHASLVSSTGTIIETPYEEINLFGDGLAAVKMTDKWGYVNTKIEEKIKPQFEWADLFINKTAVIKQKGKYGLIDKTGKIIILPDYEDYKNDSASGTRKLIKSGKEYLITENGILK